MEGEVKHFCRFGSENWELLNQSELTFKEVKTKKGTLKYVAEIVPGRNDEKMTEHNRLAFQHWRANINVQLCLDVHGVIKYTAKYVSKGEKKSEEIKDILKNMVQYMDDDTDASRAITKLMMKRAAQRDWGKPEVCHYATEGCSWGSSFFIRKINLNPEFSVEIDPDKPSKTIEKNDHLVWYQKRPKAPEFENMNFDMFTRIYDVNNKSGLQHIPQSRFEKDVRRFIPKFPANPNGKNYWKYCKFQLIRYKPWRKMSDLFSEDASPEDVIKTYKEFLESSSISDFMNDWLEDLHAAEEVVKAMDEGEDINIEWKLDETYTFANKKYYEKMVTENIVPVEEDLQVWKDSLTMNYDDESIYKDGYTSGDIDIFLKKISQQLKEGFDVENTLVEREEVCPETLEPEGQREAFDLVKKHFENTSNNDPLRLVITGTAGTGKSYLIDALKTLLGESCILTATTGCAGFNIQGVTIHSLLKLCAKKLSSKRLMELQEKLKDIKYIVIDEMSMMGSRTLNLLNKRLKTIFPESEEEFGGMSIILVGDFGQLPPVKDIPMWKKQFGDDTIMGYNAYRTFKKAISLSVVRRQKDQKFKKLLMRIRNGGMKKKDCQSVWKKLLTRDPQLLDLPDDYEDIIRLFYSNQSVHDYNIKKIVFLT